MQSIPNVSEVKYADKKLSIACEGGRHNLGYVMDELKKADVSYGRIYSELPTLNDVFLTITGKELRDKYETDEETDPKDKKKK
jgi:ABC-2 type transport system ATP-binding protein